MPSPNGLPSLPASILAGISTAQLDAAVISAALYPPPIPVFGIFNSTSGIEALTGYSSVLAFGFQRDQNIPTYPVEQGGFASFNKVAVPYQPRLTYVVTGGQQQITPFIAQLEAVVQDTNTYTIVNPWYSWDNANVTHYDFKQTARAGGFQLIADVWLSEVRQAAAAQFTTTGTQASATATKTADGQAQQQNGTVQTNALGTTTNPFTMPST